MMKTLVATILYCCFFLLSYSNESPADGGKTKTGIPGDRILYTLSGKVLHEGSNVPFEGVTIVFSSVYGPLITNSLGEFSVQVERGWSGTITPEYCGYYLFTPMSRTYTNVKQNYLNQDFQSEPAEYFTVSGTVINSFTSTLLSNFLIDFGNGITATTNLQGQYMIELMPCVSYTLTPQSEDYNFTPLSRSYQSITSDFHNEDYEAMPSSFDLPPGWDYVNTGNPMIISVFSTSNPNFCGTPLQEGDYIGVFYTGDDGLLHCGGASMWLGDANVLVTAMGNDTYTPEKDGFNYAETMNWKLYSWTNTQNEYIAYPVYNGSGTVANNKWYPIGPVSIKSLPGYNTHNLQLFEGWSGISSYLLPAIIPPDATRKITTIMSPILSKLVILQNLTQMYYPSQNINTIINWNSQTGYKIKVSGDIVLPVNGCAVASRTVNLVTTWNILPVLSECDADVVNLFAPVINKLRVVKEIAGAGVYWPAMNINTLETLEAGKACMVAVTSNCSVTYPACSGSFKAGSSTQLLDIPDLPWIEPVQTPSSHTIALNSDAIVRLNEHDVIGAFTPDGICAGVSVIGNMSENGVITVFGDDPTTTGKDGFYENEKIQFRVYTPGNDQECIVGVTYDESLPSSDGLFTDPGLSAIIGIHFASVLSGQQGSDNIGIFPNPASGGVIIRLNDISETGIITFLDVCGQKQIISKAAKENYFDTSGLPKGIYIVLVEVSGYSFARKLVIE